jgi:glyoxylase-like metal-dependent hydrolase (beta-lactamase superfamily II)
VRRFAAVYALALTASASVLPAQSWCSTPPRVWWDSVERVPVRDAWFRVHRVGPGVLALYEPGNYQEVISYLITGSRRALLFDTGMGMSRIAEVVRELTSLPVTVVNSHTHHDHVGGNAEFRRVLAMNTAFTRRSTLGSSHARVADEVAVNAICTTSLPAAFDTAQYHIRPFRTTGVIREGSTIDLGGRVLEVLHVPGHTPDAIALVDRAAGALFTGDTFYAGPIYLFSEGTDLMAYERSIDRLAVLVPSLRVLHPGHNTARVDPAVLLKVRETFHAARTGRIAGAAQANGVVQFEGDGFSFLLRMPAR